MKKNTPADYMNKGAVSGSTTINITQGDISYLNANNINFET